MRLVPLLSDLVSVERAGDDRQQQLTVILTGRGSCQSVNISHSWISVRTKRILHWRRRRRRRTVQGVQ